MSENPKLDRDALRTSLEEIMAHLGVAKMQTLPSDNRIIAGHVSDALAIATTLYRCA